MRLGPVASLCAALPLACAAEDVATRWRAEAHGFVSFGWLQTWENAWLGDTLGGTSQFHEAAVNVIARPIDRLRVGAQLFSRDLVRYDNNRVELDWAYADYGFADAVAVAVGRIKMPIGLYNESLDVDAARTPAFLPISVYALRSRDLFLSVDGAKVHGRVGLGDAGAGEYALYGGWKRISTDSGTATYFSELGLGERIVDIEVGHIVGGMAQWDTPVPGLALRASLARLDDLLVDGDYASFGGSSRSTADYWFAVASVLFEIESVTLVAEWSRLHGRGETVVEPALGSTPIDDDGEGGYLSATWDCLPWMSLYLAGEAAYGDAEDRSGPHSYRAVAAVALRPLPHWTIKLEAQHVDGTLGITAEDNPQGIEHQWQMLALKTTVDF